MRRLIVRPGGIGDFIVAIPAMKFLRSHYTEVWCASANVPLAGFANRARSIQSSGLDRLGILPDDDILDRLSEFHSIFSWYGANRPEFRQFVHNLGLPFEFHGALPEGDIPAHDFFSAQVGAPLGLPPRIEVDLPWPLQSIGHLTTFAPRPFWLGAIAKESSDNAETRIGRNNDTAVAVNELSTPELRKGNPAMRRRKMSGEGIEVERLGLGNLGKNKHGDVARDGLPRHRLLRHHL